MELNEVGLFMGQYDKIGTSSEGLPYRIYMSRFIDIDIRPQTDGQTDMTLSNLCTYLQYEI
jgi:hypothetical protein